MPAWRRLGLVAGSLAVAGVLLGIGAGFAAAQTAAPRGGLLGQYLPRIDLLDMVPGAERFGPIEGRPPAITAYKDDEIVGYVFVTSDVVDSRGYSFSPIVIAMGIDGAGKILATRLIDHDEPMLVTTIDPKLVTAFVGSYVGYDFMELDGGPGPWTDRQPRDVISGVTRTVMVIDSTIRSAAYRLARTRGIGGPMPRPRRLDMEQSGSKPWEALLAEGSLSQFTLPAPYPAAAGTYSIDVFMAQVSVPVIGQSLLGRTAWRQLNKRLEEDQQAFLVMVRGDLSILDRAPDPWARFFRLTAAQGVNIIPLTGEEYEPVGRILATGAPAFDEMALFTVPWEYDFDPTARWRLRMPLKRPGLDAMALTYALYYDVPETYIASPPDPNLPPWVPIWRSRTADIVILSVLLGALTLLFFSQDWLARRPQAADRVRLGFLAFSMVWLGFIVLGQLSVINVLTMTRALGTGFQWGLFLMDPIIFIQWAALAAALLFWGRGAYCGWLCPFGAMQELLNRAGRLFRVPQFTVPWRLHERLWPIKYVIFLGLFGLSIYSMNEAMVYAEVEPFRTAIILRFVGKWPFVVYAVALLAIGLFVNRFFCRYICPLGAALAIPARLRMFDWLKRWHECGAPCQICYNSCPVQAIYPTGEINPVECIYCMKCQNYYWDWDVCPHQMHILARRQRAMAAE